MATMTRTSRLGIRLNPEQKQLIEQAARLRGQSISAFTVASAVRAAQHAMQQASTLTLSDADRTTFLEALDNSPRPNARLMRASQAHAKSVRL